MCPFAVYRLALRSNEMKRDVFWESNNSDRSAKRLAREKLCTNGKMLERREEPTVCDSSAERRNSTTCLSRSLPKYLPIDRLLSTKFSLV